MNQNNFLPFKILKGVAFIIVVFLVIFVYSFMGSRLGGNDRRNPEAYGHDSLEAVGEPVMKIKVWQVNSFNSKDYPHEVMYSSRFYNIIDLPLTEGMSVISAVDLNNIGLSARHPIIQVDHGGPINGEYDLKYSGTVLYMKTDNYAPVLYHEDDSVFSSEDGTFSGKDSVTLAIRDPCSFLYSEHLYKKNTDYLNSVEAAGNFKLEDYYEIQKITDVYEDVPTAINNLTRYVMTTNLKINAMDPIKQDIVIATAVLEINSYSRWLGINNDGDDELLSSIGGTNEEYATVTVVSYEQSEMLALE